MARVLIVGGPGTGKTTLATEMGGGFCTDNVISMGWSEASEEVSTWFDRPYTVIEGVAIARALRKWRDRNPGKPPPCDKIIYLRTPHKELVQGQISMSKGVDTVMNELLPWLQHLVENK